MTIEISLTGAVTIDRTSDGSVERCRLRGVQQSVAFAMLVLERDGGVSRDALADALWPDLQPATWRTALRNIVSRLRAALTGVLGGDDPVSVQAGRYRLRLPAGAVVDIEAAAKGVAAAEEALHAGDPARARRLAGAAIDLLQEPFLPGSSSRWAMARRGYVAELHLSGLEVVSRSFSAVGDHAAALVAAKEVVARAPLRESAHRCVIGALAASGNRAEALRTYQLLRTMLAEELGVDPAPETEAAYLDLLVRQSSPSPSAGPGPAPPLDRAPDARSSNGSSRPEGSAGLPVLLAAWAAAIEGRLQVVVVAEPSGGESRSVTEAARRIVADAGSVLFGGRDRDPAARAPFQPLVEALDGLLAARAPDLVPSRPGAAAQLRRVFPSLNGHRSTAGPDDDALFGEAVADVLLAATADRPTMLVLDDLPWEGGRASAWLPHLVRRAEAARLLLVLVERAETPGGGEAARIAEALAGLAPRVWSLPAVAPEAPVALATGRRASGRLPTYATSFVGREDESGRTLALLREGRLVTLVGEAGIGKSRLAVEAAQRAPIADYPDGVGFCDVSAVPEGRGLVEHIAAAVGLVSPPGAGQREELAAWLARQQLLLVLDNCEALARPVAQLVEELLAAAADLRVLATSRAALRAGGEHVVRVHPLGWPRPGGRGGAGHAVQLLVDRATTAGAVVHVDDPALDRIARRLDDMPLAIELVAPRLASLPAAAVAARLDRVFDLLDDASATTRRAPESALRATIDWSFTLLSPAAQRLFAGLSVFRGGWTIETATAVAEVLDIDRESVPMLMTELAEQSMIRLDTSAAGTARYDILATLQAYGADRLVRSGHAAAAAEGHAAQFVDLVERSVTSRRGPTEAAGASQLVAELDNLRVTYRWALDAGRPHDALRLVAALGYDAVMREWFEVGRWATEVAARDDVADDPLRSVALAVASTVAFIEHRFEDAAQLSAASLASERRTGAPPCWMSRYTQVWMIFMGIVEGDWRARLKEMADIGTSTGEPLAVALADFVRARIRVLGGRPERGRVAADRLLELGTGLSNPTVLAMALLAHGWSAADTRPEVAATDFHHAFQVASSVHNLLLAQQALRAGQQLDARTGHPAATLTSLATVARRFERWGNLLEQVDTVMCMLEPLLASGALVEAARVCGVLSPTPWAHTAAYRRIDDALAELLPLHEHNAARRAGALVPLTGLVAFVLPLVDDIAGRGDP